jgi:hypothetical protein
MTNLVLKFSRSWSKHWLLLRARLWIWLSHRLGTLVSSCMASTLLSTKISSHGSLKSTCCPVSPRRPSWTNESRRCSFAMRWHLSESSHTQSQNPKGRQALLKKVSTALTRGSLAMRYWQTTKCRCCCALTTNKLGRATFKGFILCKPM